MSGRPQDQYDDGYGHQNNDPRTGGQSGQNTDSYYQDDQNGGYYDDRGYADDGRGHNQQGMNQGGDGYYDES